MNTTSSRNRFDSKLVHDTYGIEQFWWGVGWFGFLMVWGLGQGDGFLWFGFFGFWVCF